MPLSSRRTARIDLGGRVTPAHAVEPEHAAARDVLDVRDDALSHPLQGASSFRTILRYVADSLRRVRTEGRGRCRDDQALGRNCAFAVLRPGALHLARNRL